MSLSLTVNLLPFPKCMQVSVSVAMALNKLSNFIIKANKRASGLRAGLRKKNYNFFSPAATTEELFCVVTGRDLLKDRIVFYFPISTQEQKSFFMFL